MNRRPESRYNRREMVHANETPPVDMRIVFDYEIPRQQLKHARSYGDDGVCALFERINKYRINGTRFVKVKEKERESVTTHT